MGFGPGLYDVIQKNLNLPQLLSHPQKTQIHKFPNFFKSKLQGFLHF